MKIKIKKGTENVWYYDWGEMICDKISPYVDEFDESATCNFIVEINVKRIYKKKKKEKQK